MADNLRVGVRLTADGGALATGLGAAEQRLDQFARRGRKAGEELDQAFGSINRGVARLGSQLGDLKNTVFAAAGLTGLGTVAAQAIASADAMSTLRSRLDLVTGSAERTASVQARLFEIAQQSRVGFTELGATFAQIARSSSELGISQDRLLGVTRALSQAMTIGGGSAASQSAALTQLSQGLASGTLRGEELNSILEQTPRVAQAIAQGLGVGIGQLRKLGEEGALTARAVIEALEKAAPQLAAEFEKVKPTISGAFVTVKNAAADFVGELDRATGGSESLAASLTGMARSITEAKAGIGAFVETAKPLAEMALWAAGGIALARALQTIASVGVGAGALALLGRMGGFLGGPMGAAAAVGATVAGAATADDAPQRTVQAQIDAALRRNGGRETGEVTFLRRQLEAAGGPRADGFGLPPLAGYSADTTRDVEAFDRGLTAAQRAARAYAGAPDSMSRAQRAQAERDRARADARGVLADLERAGADPSEAGKVNAALAQRLANIDEKYKPAAGLKEALNDRRQALAAALADERAALETAAKLQLGIIQSLGKQGVLTEEQVVSQRLAVQRRAIDGQIQVAEAARAAAGADASEKARATGQINALVRERLEVEQQANRELAELAAKRAAAADTEAQAYRKARYDNMTALRESVQSMAEENQARLRAIATGLDEAEMLRELRIARLEAELAVDERPDPEKIERIRLLRDEIRLLRERRQIDAEQGERRASESQAQRLADDIARREQDITRSLNDALYRGFENSKGLAENFRDTLRSTIGTLVLRPLIEPVVKPLATAASGFIEQLVGAGLNALTGAAGGGVDWSSAPDQFDAETARLSRKSAGGSASGSSSSITIPQTFYINAGVDATTAMNIVQQSKVAALAEIRDATSRNDPTYTG